MPLDGITAGAPSGGLNVLEPVLDVLGEIVAEGVSVPMPGRDGLNASQEVLPAYDTYPAQSVTARLSDLIDRKVEQDGIDFVLWLENQLA